MFVTENYACFDQLQSGKTKKKKKKQLEAPSTSTSTSSQQPGVVSQKKDKTSNRPRTHASPVFPDKSLDMPANEELPPLPDMSTIRKHFESTTKTSNDGVPEKIPIPQQSDTQSTNIQMQNISSAKSLNVIVQDESSTTAPPTTMEIDTDISTQETEDIVDSNPQPMEDEQSDTQPLTHPDIVSQKSKSSSQLQDSHAHNSSQVVSGPKTNIEQDATMIDSDINNKILENQETVSSKSNKLLQQEVSELNDDEQNMIDIDQEEPQKTNVADKNQKQLDIDDQTNMDDVDKQIPQDGNSADKQHSSQNDNENDNIMKDVELIIKPPTQKNVPIHSAMKIEESDDEQRFQPITIKYVPLPFTYPQKDSLSFLVTDIDPEILKHYGEIVFKCRKLWWKPDLSLTNKTIIQNYNRRLLDGI